MEEFAIDLSDDDTAPLNPYGDQAETKVPPPAVVDRRAGKYDYALEQYSPGKDALRNTILSGGEASLRENMSLGEDLQFNNEKQRLMGAIAQAKGKELTSEEMSLIWSISKTELKNNPETVLEQKFAERFIRDVLSIPGAQFEYATVSNVIQDVEIGTGIEMWKQIANRELEELKAENDARSIWSAIPDLTGQLMPIYGTTMSWWRQAHALSQRPGVELLPGKTQKANIEYLYTLPIQERVAQFKQAIEYLKNKNLYEAIAFAEAAVSFGTSSEYLASSLLVADYVGMLPLKGLRAAKGGPLKKEGKGIDYGETFGPYELYGPHKPSPKGTRAYDRPIGPGMTSPEHNNLVEEFQRIVDQGELFGPQQYDLKGIRERAQISPALKARVGETDLPPGKLRASQADRLEPYTGEGGEYFLPGKGSAPKYPARGPGGRMVRQPTQGELPLPEPVSATRPTTFAHQTEMVLEQVQATKRTIAEAVAAAEGPSPSVSSVLSAAGDLARAGAAGAVERVVANVATKGVVEGFDDLVKTLPTFANPKGFFQDSKVLGNEYARRVVDYLTVHNNKLIEGLKNPLKVTRLTSEALRIGLDQAHDYLKREFGRLGNSNDAVLNVGHLPADVHPANVDHGYLVLGRKDATAFRSREEAIHTMEQQYGLSPQQYVITDQGSGYVGMVFKAVDETSKEVRDALVVSPKNITPTHGFFPSIFNRIRSAADLLPQFQMAARDVATHAPQEIRKQIRDIELEVRKKMAPRERRELEDMLRVNRDVSTTGNPSDRGFFYQTAGSFERAFFDRHKKAPTAAQIEGYDTYRRLSDWDWLARNIAVYRDKARQGVETMSVTIDKKTPWFDGKVHDHVPWYTGKHGEQDAGLYVWDAAVGKGRYHHLLDVTADQKKAIDEMTQSGGYRVVQVFDPKTHPLEGIAMGAEGPIKDQINYIVTNALEKRPLDWQQVEYRPGVHVVYPHEWYIAQPVINLGRRGKEFYLGDNVAINLRTRAEAVKYSALMNEARILLKGAKDAELETFLKQNLPFYDKKEFSQLFNRSDSPFNIDHPIVFKQHGRNTWDTVESLKNLFPQVIDSTKNAHDLSNWMDKTFLQDRNAIIKTIDERAMRLADAEQLDPYIALQKSINQSLRNMYHNDYKITAIESWLREFKDVMRPDEKVLISHPTYFLYNPQWVENTENRARLAAAKAAQRAIVNFLGTQSELGAELAFQQRKVMDTIYKVSGQRGLDILDGADRITEAAGLGSIKDPVTFMRGLAFHTKLGLLNPVQFFVQAQATNHIIGVAGLQNGLPGVFGGWLTRAAMHNPGMVDTLANVAKAVGWKADDWKEMFEAMKRTGLFQVAGEAVLRDDALDPKLFQNAMGRFFDKGAFFFNEGERLVRLGAFATAYREFKKANPGKIIGNRELGEIMYRSDNLSLNMTRASSAEWQQGVFAVPTQFFAFNARLMEQLVGKRLTWQEKARVTAWNSLVYGMPVAGGMWTMGTSPLQLLPGSSNLPWGGATAYEDIRQEAILRGVNMNDAWFKAATEGLMGFIFPGYNASARFGPGASTSINAWLSEDKSFQEILFGASGSIFGDMVKATYPFIYAAASVFTDTGEYPTATSDWMNLARNVATIDIGSKAILAASYGKWITKTGTSVGPADGIDAMMAILGLTPANIADTYVGKKALDRDKDARSHFENDAVDNFRKGMQAAAAGDDKTMEAHFKRARTSMQAGDFTFADEKRIFQRAMKSTGDLQDKVNLDLLRKARKSRSQDALDSFIRKQQ